MRATAPGEAVIELPWLCPAAEALASLTRTPVPWDIVRHDPAAVLLVIRHTSAFATPDIPFSANHLLDPLLIESALRGLREHADIAAIDWSADGPRQVRAAALHQAQLAHRIATTTGRCAPEHAWIGGLLAPLGWLAVCAVNPNSAGDCLNDPDHPRQPAQVEQRHWGFDQAALARRLARRWRLPPWLTAIVGYLGLPPEDGARCGVSPELAVVVRLAVALVQRSSHGLRLTVGASPEELAANLGLTPTALDELAQSTVPPPTASDSAPIPLLIDLLTLAAENRRLRDVPTLRRAESDADALADALQKARASEAERLRSLKMASIAELAAGAGHEINNPLAVISGQAQFLLNKLLKGERKTNGALHSGNGTEYSVPSTEPPSPQETEEALRRIIDQTQRIHHILRELMQFARPPQPQKQLIDAGDLVQEVATSLTELAHQRSVRLAVPRPEHPVAVVADPGQVRTALTCLLRNAVEAAPAEGWAGVRIETPSADTVAIIVEDNGDGPPQQQREHLFDPFYSGRTAGRGRGLGLPTAWRFAQQHGGDVQFTRPPDGPTRFVLSLPAHANGNGQA